MGMTTFPDTHTHSIYLDTDDILALMKDKKEIVKDTTEASGHTHSVKLVFCNHPVIQCNTTNI